MGDPKSSGASTSAIPINIDVDLKVEGKVMVHSPDGETKLGSPSQEFVRIEKGRLAKGDWLINPMTNETHKVLEAGVGGVSISTEGGGVYAVAWHDVIETLLLVVHV